MQVETRNLLTALQASMPANAIFTPYRNQIQAWIDQANIREQLYFYQVNIADLATGATSSPTALAIQGDAPFVIQAGMLWAVNNAAQTNINPANRVCPLITVQLNDQSGPGNLQNIAVPVQNLFGVDGIPYAWPRQYTMPANSQLTITATNYDSALTYDLYFTFIGVKLFNAQ